MFDGNGADIDVGEYFFGEVHSDNVALRKLGVKVGTIILCQHKKKPNDLPTNHINTRIWLGRRSIGINFVWSGEEVDSAYIVYSGLPDGSSFLCQNWRAKALDFLDGEWISGHPETVFK